jgi:hypothetical protein
LTEEIGEPALEGRFGADDGEVGALTGRQGQDVCRTGDIDGDTGPDGGHSWVPWSRQDAGDVRIAAEPPHEGVLAPARSDNENAHGP